MNLLSIRSIYFCTIFTTIFSFPSSAEIILLEAETGTGNGIETANIIQDFSGSGYITSFDAIGDYLELTFTTTLEDQYKIEVAYTSTTPANSSTSVWIDGVPFSEMRTALLTSFTAANAGTFYVTAGEHSIRLQYNNASLNIDFIRLTPVSEIQPHSLENDVTRIEAEEGILLGTRVELGSVGFSGSGYVANFDVPMDDKLRLLIFSDSAREYDLTIGYGTPYGYKENYLSINQGPRQTIAFAEVTGFSEVQVGKVALKKGINELEIIHFWGWFELDYFEFSRVIGQAPLAISQGNILAEDVNGDGAEFVTLNALASSDPDGEINEYLWLHADGTTISSSPDTMVMFAAGSYQVKLIVIDNDGNVDEQTFAVIVADLSNLKNHRIPIYNGRDSLFMSGINIAWTKSSNFAKDLVNYQESDWTMILDEVQDAGGNAVRWWLHTNGSVSPRFGSDGKVSGLDTESIDNMRRVLDLAFDRGIVVSMCLWSFDMLQNQGQNLAHTRAILEDSLATIAYIDNALIPILDAIGSHPSIMTWEIFNEPEGMTSEFGWSDERTTMFFVQRFINLCAGAIHRRVPTAKVSNGSWSFRASTSVDGFFDYYQDDTLVSAGGDPDGILDLVQVHYYDHIGISGSPFHHPAAYWGIDKPIIIGEFPAHGIEGFSVEECYQFAYRLGYAGALSWSYSDTQFGGLDASVPGLKSLFNNYPEDIIIPDTNMVVAIKEIDGFDSINMFPNPVKDNFSVEIIGHENQSVNFEVINMNGQIILRDRLDINALRQIDVEMLSPGTYNIRFIGKRNISNRLFIKQ